MDFLKKYEQLSKKICTMRGEAVGLQKLLTSFPSIAPESGGDGEWEKAAALEKWLAERDIVPAGRLDAPDDRVKSGKRPNLWLELKGKDNSRATWIMSHLDVVPPGEQSLWDGPPFVCREVDGKLFGRGTEDNQQGMVSSLLCLLAYKQTGIIPSLDLKLLFISDEEISSVYGIDYAINNGIQFNPGDAFIVPDGGAPDGSFIEIAEKTILWYKFTVEGKQCHASKPESGANSFLASSALVVELSKKLSEKFPQTDDLFDPPQSTFAPTKKEKNVDNINTIPGEDVFYMDFRVLPGISEQRIDSAVKDICGLIAGKFNMSIKTEIVDKTLSGWTAPDASLVKCASRAVKIVKGADARIGGYGGGTVAAFLRNRGYDSIVWSSLEETAHMPNEYCLIENMIEDAKVMALTILLREE